MEKAKIEKINKHLEKIGSRFRTIDGLTLSCYIGNLTFLKRTFNTIDDCYIFVMNCK